MHFRHKGVCPGFILYCETHVNKVLTSGSQLFLNWPTQYLKAPHSRDSVILPLVYSVGITTKLHFQSFF